MERQDLRAALDLCYEARLSKDSEKLAELFADDARYDVVGANEMIDQYTGASSDATGVAIDDIMRLVDMKEAKPVSVLIDGNRAAVRLRTTLSVGNRPSFETELSHWWEFDDNGKVRSLTEFVDTAKLAGEFSALN